MPSITLGTQASNSYVNAIGAFVQDSISLGGNVKLDLGLRYDYLPSPTEQDNKLVTFDPASLSLLQINGPGGFTQVTKNGSDFQPRLGLIWDPKGDGKTVVRSAYAIMVNQSNTGYFSRPTRSTTRRRRVSSSSRGSAPTWASRARTLPTVARKALIQRTIQIERDRDEWQQRSLRGCSATRPEAADRRRNSPVASEGLQNSAR